MNVHAEGWKPAPECPPHAPLRLRRLGIETHQEAVVFMRADCPVCRAEGFAARSRINVQLDERWIIATLHVVTSDLLAHGEASLSDVAWRRLNAQEGDQVFVSHPMPPRSFDALRAKIDGAPFGDGAIEAIVADVAAGHYDDLQLAALVTVFANGVPQVSETVAFTRALVRASERMRWDARVVADLHSLTPTGEGALPLLVASIVAANGVLMPMSVSAASGAAATAAQVMAALAPVDLDQAAVRRVVEREGACITWASRLGLSPVSDQFERIAHALGVAGEVQTVASLYAHKLAAGVTHLLIEVPVTPGSRLSDGLLADRLVRHLTRVASPLGLSVDVLLRETAAPLGRGVGPGPEAIDLLEVLQNAPGAPRELRARALVLAGNLLEFCGVTPEGTGLTLARETLASGRARDKFLALCDAQGGFRSPRRPPCRELVCSEQAGLIDGFDPPCLATVARLAGAQRSDTAGVVLHVNAGDRIDDGQPLYSVLSDAPGELAYAMEWVRHAGHGVRIVKVAEAYE